MENNLDIKKKIMEVAKNVFLEKGYKETRIIDISQKLKMSPTTIYLYFNGKKDLFSSLNIPEAEKKQPKYEQKRKHILDEALFLFGEKGFDGTSMNMIAKNTGLSKAALYQYFEDKNDLFIKVLEETPLHLTIKTNLKKNNLKEVVLDIAKAYMSIFDSPERIAFTRTIFRDSIKYPEISSLYHERSIGYTAKYLAGILNEFKNLLRDDLDTLLAATTYIGSLFAFSIQYKVIKGLKKIHSDKEFVEETTNIFLRGILKNGAITN